jgi:hypothetical protein
VSGWKVQKFFGDLVYDLRSRNLLPIVLMLVVAMVAVPFLVSSGGSSGSDVSLSAPATVKSSPEAQNAVVAYHPGIRNLKKRLNDLGPKNPFIQQLTNPTGPGAASGSATENVALPSDFGTGSSTGSGSGGGTNGGGGNGGGGNGGGGSSGGGKTKTVYTYYLTSVTISDGGAPATVNNLRQFQFLPNDATPVLTYLGTASGGKQALFLVSKDVTSVGGTGVCFPSADACQLLGLNAGAGADLAYPPDGKTYHLQVKTIRRVNSTQPPG